MKNRNIKQYEKHFTAEQMEEFKLSKKLESRQEQIKEEICKQTSGKGLQKHD